MGIDGFNKIIQTNYAKAIKEVWVPFYDCVYIDINFCLYHIVHISTGVDNIIERLEMYVKNILKYALPRRKVVFVADGQAPMAKLNLQMQRRSNKNDSHLSVHFAPGTKFMENLRNALKLFTDYVRNTYYVDVDDSMITGYGEGELKILAIAKKISYEHPTYTHLIFSNDSDVILMFMQISNAFVCHKEKGRNLCYNLSYLLHLHNKTFSNGRTSPVDFMFCNLLLGNDYLPKILYVTYEKIWKAYDKLICFYPNGIVNEGTIDNLFLCELLENIHNQMKIKKLSYFEPCEPAINYLEGLNWCLQMYLNGTCVDYSYMYKYVNSPIIHNVIVEGFKYDFAKKLTLRENTLHAHVYGLILTYKSSILKEIMDQKTIAYSKTATFKNIVQSKLITWEKTNGSVDNFVNFVCS